MQCRGFEQDPTRYNKGEGKHIKKYKYSAQQSLSKKLTKLYIHTYIHTYLNLYLLLRKHDNFIAYMNFRSAKYCFLLI